MAEAFIKGLSSGGLPAGEIMLSEPNEDRRELMVERYQIGSAASNSELVDACNIVVLAIKPQIIQNVLDEIREPFCSTKLLVSILAGVSPTTLEEGLSVCGSPRVVRAMPTPPSLVSKGAAALCAGSKATDEDRRIARLPLLRFRALCHGTKEHKPSPAVWAAPQNSLKDLFFWGMLAGV